jgi:hypothetical protein
MGEPERGQLSRITLPLYRPAIEDMITDVQRDEMIAWLVSLKPMGEDIGILAERAPLVACVRTTRQ